MANSSKKLVVRHGNLEDKNSLTDMDVYHGMDYLSATYDTYCQDPNRINYILEADGIVVCIDFCMAGVGMGGGDFTNQISFICQS